MLWPSPFPTRQFPTWEEATPLRILLVKFKSLVPSPKDAIMHWIPLKRSSILSMAKIENLWKSTYKVEFTSIKKVYTTFVIFMKRVTKKSPSKCLWPLLHLQIKIGIPKKKLKLQPKANKSENKIEECRQELYRHGYGWVHVHTACFRTYQPVCKDGSTRLQGWSIRIGPKSVQTGSTVCTDEVAPTLTCSSIHSNRI